MWRIKTIIVKWLNKVLKLPFFKGELLHWRKVTSATDGTDLCAFINDFNRRSRSIPKLPVGESRLVSIISLTRTGIWDKISVTLRLESREARLDLIALNAWLGKDQCRIFFSYECTALDTHVRWKFTLGAGNSSEKNQQNVVVGLSKADGELSTFGQLENGWERLWLFSMNLLVGVGKGAGDEKRTAGREKSGLNWRTMLAQE